MKINKTWVLYGKAFGLILFLFFFSLSSFASEPVVWELSSRSEILKGDARGVSITNNGTVLLAPKMTQLFDTTQAFVWSSAVDDRGNVFLGTGHDGRVYKVGADGKGALFYDSNELDVTALATGKDGSVYAGTSPDGKVYRISADGKADVYFDPTDKYIWSLALMNDGSLAVGTGDNGKIYRVKTSGAKQEDSLLYSTNETHVISMAVDAQGNLIAGTDSNGLVLRISPNGKAFALFDSPLREIHSLAVASDGSVYVLALSDAASGGGRPAGTTTSSTSDSGVTTTVTVSAVDDSSPTQSPQKSRNDVSTAKSVVYRILPEGGYDVLFNSASVVGFSIAAQDGRVLIGTSDKGRIYSVTNDGRDTLLLQSTEGQISTLQTRGRDVFATSSNQGKLFRFGSETNTEGTFESPVRDTKLSAAWGKVWWRGAGNVQLQTRSGNTERPDQTWSDWSAAYADAKGTQVASPRARYVQWRAVLKTGTSEARLEDVSLAYIPRNVAPEVLSIQTFPLGVGLQPGIPPQVDPNIESSGLDPSLFGVVTQIPPRRVYQRGALSIQWQAEDRNGDKLEYAIYYRGINERDFRLLKENVRDNFFTIDGAALSDGRYVFKIVVSDAPGNPLGQELKGEMTSEPVDVDNTPPSLKSFGEPQIAGNRVRVVIDAEDSAGRIDRADISVDGGDWKSVLPEDGIADSSKERFALDLQIAESGEHTVSLRVYDKSGNVGSIRVIVRK